MKIMKKLIVPLSAAALTALTLNTNAALLSPRASGNQVATASGLAHSADRTAVQQGIALSPRVSGNTAAITADAENSVNPSLACRNMAASPKAIQSCAANPSAAMPCCKAMTTAN